MSQRGGARSCISGLLVGETCGQTELQRDEKEGLVECGVGWRAFQALLRRPSSVSPTLWQGGTRAKDTAPVTTQPRNHKGDCARAPQRDVSLQRPWASRANMGQADLTTGMVCHRLCQKHTVSTKITGDERPPQLNKLTHHLHPQKLASEPQHR